MAADNVLRGQLIPSRRDLGLLSGALGLVRTVSVQWGRDRNPAAAVRSGDNLVGIVFNANSGTRGVKILEHHASHPDAWNFDVGNNVAGADALDPARAVKLLSLIEEIPGLLGFGDRKAAHGCNGKGRVVVTAHEAFDVPCREIASVAGEKILDLFSSRNDVFHKGDARPDASS